MDRFTEQLGLGEEIRYSLPFVDAYRVEPAQGGFRRRELRISEELFF